MPRVLGPIFAVAVAMTAAVYLEASPQDEAVNAASARATEARTLPRAATPQRALIDQYCVGCHNERRKTAGLMLDKLDITATGSNAEVIEKVIRKLRSGAMPPVGMPRPDRAQAQAFAASLEGADVRPEVPIVPASLGNDAGAIGAALLALEAAAG